MDPKSILIFRNGSIGNTLAATPALRALRSVYPESRITIVLDTIGAELLKHSNSIEEIIVYEKRGADKGLTGYLRLVQKLRTTMPTHAILFKRFFRNGLLARLSGAKERIGFETDRSAPFLNRTIPYDESIPIVDLNLRLVELLGVKSTERAYELILGDEDREQASKVIFRHKLEPKNFVVVHYGGSTTRPNFFPIERFAELLNSVCGSARKAVAIGAGISESMWADQLKKDHSRLVPVLDLPVRTMAALIESANLFVGFNSGPAHISAAVSTPEIIFYRPDKDVKREIHKWKPVAETTKALIPPETSNEHDWEVFIQSAADIAKNLTANPMGRGSVL